MRHTYDSGEPGTQRPAELCRCVSQTPVHCASHPLPPHLRRCTAHTRTPALRRHRQRQRRRRRVCTALRRCSGTLRCRCTYPPLLRAVNTTAAKPTHARVRHTTPHHTSTKSQAKHTLSVGLQPGAVRHAHTQHRIGRYRAQTHFKVRPRIGGAKRQHFIAYSSVQCRRRAGRRAGGVGWRRGAVQAAVQRRGGGRVGVSGGRHHSSSRGRGRGGGGSELFAISRGRGRVGREQQQL